MISAWAIGPLLSSSSVSNNENLWLFGNVGAVRVYSNQNGILRKVGSDIYGENISDNFGMSVSLSSDGSLVAISADDHDAIEALFKFIETRDHN